MCFSKEIDPIIFRLGQARARMRKKNEQIYGFFFIIYLGINVVAAVFVSAFGSLHVWLK